MPLNARDHLIGIIMLYSPARETIQKTDLDIAFATVAQTAIAVDNARLFTEVRRLAIIDELTGIFNRRHFFELAEREFKRSKRYQQPLTCLMIDIDHFKKVNDTFGHDCGDAILKLTAATILNSIRENDIFGRYGGEEFALIITDTPPGRVLIVAQRLLNLIRGQCVDSDYPDCSVTISIGIAYLEKTDQQLSHLLKKADQALYTAKREGRDRLNVFGLSADENDR